MNGPTIKITKNTNTISQANVNQVDIFVNNAGELVSVDENGNVKNYGQSIGPSGVNHSLLQNLSNDDHPQYHNDVRGDLRYYTKSQVDSFLLTKANTSHTHAASQITDFATQVDAVTDPRFDSIETDVTNLQNNKLDNFNALNQKTTAVEVDNEIILRSGLNVERDYLRRVLEISVDRCSEFKTDFIVDAIGGLSQFNAGAGSSNAQSAVGMNLTDRCLGVTRSQTGTTTTGRAALGCATGGTIYPLFNFSNSLSIYRQRCALEVLSDNADNYFLNLGFTNSYNNANANPTQGVYFRYNHAFNGGRFSCHVVRDGVEVWQDSGVLADINFHVFEIRMATTEVQFFIDGNLVATETNQIPNQPSQTFGFGFKIQKTAGTATRAINTDFIMFQNFLVGGR